MLGRNHVGLSKKKLLVILVVVLIGILIFSWIFFDNIKEIISEIKGCSEFRDSFNI